MEELYISMTSAKVTRNKPVVQKFGGARGKNPSASKGDLRDAGLIYKLGKINWRRK